MLQLDTNKFINDLYNRLYKSLDEVAKHGVEYMVFELANLGSNDDIGSWKRDVISALKYIGIAKANEICIEFGMVNADFLNINKALSLNYGIGELLDRDNPYLQEYMNSEYYNKSRDNFKVYSRPGEHFLDFDTGEIEMSKATSREELPFAKLEPIHFFENALVFIMPEMDKAIDNVINDIEFSDYLIDI